jgi:hypothetical protein
MVVSIKVRSIACFASRMLFWRWIMPSPYRVQG